MKRLAFATNGRQQLDAGWRVGVAQLYSAYGEEERRGCLGCLFSFVLSHAQVSETTKLRYSHSERL